MTAFVVASVARAAVAHPEVHAYRNWRGRPVTHQYVDEATMVEISTPQGPFAILHVHRSQRRGRRPAARFGAEFRAFLESAVVISPSN